MDAIEQNEDRLKAEHDTIQNLLDSDLPGKSTENDEDYAVRLLNRLRELGVIQVSKERQCVFFQTIHNTRPLVMYLVDAETLPQFDRLLPIHVYETVNSLLWERLLEPELALAYKGLFDWMPVFEWCFALSYTLSDSAFDHLHGWLDG
jgi:hypothetical protein